MNQLIFDKFTTFNQSTVDQFHAEVTDYMPHWAEPANIYGAIIPEDNWNTDNDAPVWGETDTGVWWSRLYESVLVEDPGVVHVINAYHTQQYIDFCNTLSSLQNAIPNQWVFPKLIATETFTLDVDNHVSASTKGTQLFYIQFESQLGESIYNKFLFDETADLTPHIISYIDNVALIFSLLANENSEKYPRTIVLDHQLLNDTNSLLLLPALSLSKQTSYNFHTQHLEYSITTFLLYRSLTLTKEALLQYAGQKWTSALKI